MTLLRHALIWAAMTLTAVTVLPALTAVDTTTTLIARWQHQLDASLGAKSAAQIVERTMRSAGSASVLSPGAGGPSATAAQRGYRLALTLMLMRAMTLLAWLPVLLPLWLAAVVQGWVLREIASHRFSGGNQQVHQLCALGAVGAGGAGALALVLPVPLPLPSIPLLGMLLAVLITGAVAHCPRWRG